MMNRAPFAPAGAASSPASRSRSRPCWPHSPHTGPCSQHREESQDRQPSFCCFSVTTGLTWRFQSNRNSRRTSSNSRYICSEAKRHWLHLCPLQRWGLCFLPVVRLVWKILKIHIQNFSFLEQKAKLHSDSALQNQKPAKPGLTYCKINWFILNTTMKNSMQYAVHTVYCVHWSDAVGGSEYSLRTRLEVGPRPELVKALSSSVGWVGHLFGASMQIFCHFCQMFTAALSLNAVCSTLKTESAAFSVKLRSGSRCRLHKQTQKYSFKTSALPGTAVPLICQPCAAAVRWLTGIKQLKIDFFILNMHIRTNGEIHLASVSVTFRRRLRTERSAPQNPTGHSCVWKGSAGGARGDSAWRPVSQCDSGGRSRVVHDITWLPQWLAGQHHV